MNTFTVAAGTETAAVQAALAADSLYDRVEFAAGAHVLTQTLRILKPGQEIVFGEGAVLKSAVGVNLFVDVRAQDVRIGGSGAFDGSAQVANGDRPTFIHVRDYADGFALRGDAKPDQQSQAGALEFRNGVIGIVVAGADNAVLERLYLHDFAPGTLGIILRDVGDADGVNALGGQGTLVRDVYAQGGNGGALPGAKPANGAWIRLDTSDGHDGSTGPAVQNVQITDNILLGGHANFADDGIRYFFVNIDSNIQHAEQIDIAYNTLANAASYEIQIKDGFANPYGVTGVVVHDNIVDHSATDILRRWPLKLQANFVTPMQVAFENNLALLQPGVAADQIHLIVGDVDPAGIEYRGDFVTDLWRTVVHNRDGGALLAGADIDEWLIAGGSDQVISGGGRDLIDVRAGDGVVRVLDFEIGVDQLRLVGFGPMNILPGLRAINGQDGLINLGNGDMVLLSANGAALDLSGLNSGDIFLDETYAVVRAPDGGGTVDGSERSDRLLGSDAADHLNGGAGHDLLFGGAGADWLRGEAGADRIDPGANTDRIWGGDGRDEFVFGNGRDLNVVYDWTDGSDRIVLAGGVTIADLTFLTYGAVDAEVRAPDGSRLVLRQTDVATLGPTDFMIRGDGSAQITGGAGRDVLHGTADADTFVLTPNSDRHYGYGGADSFVFGLGTDLNIVYDFEPGLDRIGLDGLTFADLNFEMYLNRDADIQAPDGSRLVLRLIDIADLSDADFFLL